tara:strand:- start:3539 stop:3871 length:333 start_codon:yes stop_codon:yes gene_type:complete
MKPSEENYFNLLRKIYKNPNISQRDLAQEIGLSLGKVNYCVKHLKNKGLIKIQNFSKSKNKIKYIYLLTPKGIAHKMKVTIKFMQQKMKEYDELKKDIEKTKNSYNKKNT